MKAINYTLQDGGKITATCASEFVTRLREGSRFDSECSDEEYMSNFADRYKELHGISISDETPESFLNSLISCGYVSGEE
ncbi:hypothetical protein [Phocaeicola sp.]